MSAATSSASSSSKEGDKGHGLLLYLNNYSFYSQKVIMALHEKKLYFKSHIVDIVKGEQYEPWFLEINPRGEVPVLNDGVKNIPDSARIIDYLEDNFSNGDTPRLIPIDQGPEVRQKANHFRNLIDQVPANVITVGSFYHPEFVQSSPRLPFVASVRKRLMAEEESNSQVLRETAEKNPAVRQVLLQKAEAQDKKHESVVNKEAFSELLNQVDSTLAEVEKELSSHKDSDKQWLCSDRFTAADVGLTILLDRLYLVGLEARFWTGGLKPGIDHYYARVQQRDSYKQTVPSMMFHVKTFLKMQWASVLGVGIAVLCTVVGGVVLYKRRRL